MFSVETVKRFAVSTCCSFVLPVQQIRADKHCRKPSFWAQICKQLHTSPKLLPAGSESRLASLTSHHSNASHSLVFCVLLSYRITYLCCCGGSDKLKWGFLQENRSVTCALLWILKWGRETCSRAAGSSVRNFPLRCHNTQTYSIYLQCFPHDRQQLVRHSCNCIYHCWSGEQF